MKKKLLKKELILYLSLFFDIEYKTIESYFKNYKINKDIIKIKLLLYKNNKVEIWITDINKKINIIGEKKELIIIKIRKDNGELLNLERFSHVSYYTFDVIRGSMIIPKNKKEENLNKLASIYLKLKKNSNKNHDIIKKRRNL